MTKPTQPPATAERLILLAILIAYAILATLYATQTPAWQIPDEPAHVNYTRQVVKDGCCPVLERADWDADTLGEMVGSGFDPALLGDLNTVQYEDHQPPLYYLLASPIYRLADGSLTVLRLFSAILGLGMVVCVYGAVRVLSGHGILALSAAGFTAFIPQHLAILAGAGNDALAELIVAFGVLLTALYLRDSSKRVPVRYLMVLGVVMGLGFLTKASTFLLGPVVMLAILLRWWRNDDRRWVDLFASWAVFLLPAFLMGALWWGRNIGVYGWPDIMGLGRHDAVVTGQPRTADWIAEKGFTVWLFGGIATTFRSFWGQFGWMGVPMPGWVYQVLLTFMVVSYTGLVPLVDRIRKRGGLSPVQRDGVLILAALYALGIAAFLYYNTSFVQFQGRYLYPAMTAFAATASAGWVGWTGLVSHHLKASGVISVGLSYLPVIIMWGLAGLSGLALWRYLIPNLPVW